MLEEINIKMTIGIKHVIHAERKDIQLYVMRITKIVYKEIRQNQEDL